MKDCVYMMVGMDKYELPLAVSNSIDGLSRMTGASPHTIATDISRAKRLGRRCKYIKVELDEKED